jgi:hypothetical protein
LGLEQGCGGRERERLLGDSSGLRDVISIVMVGEETMNRGAEGHHELRLLISGGTGINAAIDH